MSTGGLALPTAYYVRDVDFSTVEVQRYLEELGAEIVTLDGVNQETPAGCNHRVLALLLATICRTSNKMIERYREIVWSFSGFSDFLQVSEHD